MDHENTTVLSFVLPIFSFWCERTPKLKSLAHICLRAGFFLTLLASRIYMHIGGTFHVADSFPPVGCCLGAGRLGAPPLWKIIVMWIGGSYIVARKMRQQDNSSEVSLQIASENGVGLRVQGEITIVQSLPFRNDFAVRLWLCDRSPISISTLLVR